MINKDVILWMGEPIETLSRDELYEVIRHLMLEQKYHVDRILTQYKVTL